MLSPILDCQILGKAPPGEDGGSQIRVLLTATPAVQRDFPLQVLARLGLEPEVVDLEPLAALNALLAVVPPEGDSEKALGLLDLGGRQASLHLTGRDGGIVSRPVGPGAPTKKASPTRAWAPTGKRSWSVSGKHSRSIGGATVRR
jgi:Tfp pilus assembly PilM family ATPase